MAKIFDKMRDLMFGEEYEDEEDMDYEYDKPAERSSYQQSSRESFDYAPAAPVRPAAPSQARRNTSQVVSIHTNIQMQVVIVKPENYEDAQEICDQVKNKKPVVVNLENAEFPVAQRIMDFLSGTCYSLDGTIQRVANNIFVIAPENVDISGDFKEEHKTKGIILPWVNGAKN